MDRERLVRKRNALKRRLERQQRLETVADTLQYLDQNDIPYQLLFEGKFTDTAKNFPFLFSGFDWDQIEGSIKVTYSDHKKRNRTISKVIARHLSPESLVLIAWANGNSPEMEIEASAVIDQPEIFADQDWDFWVRSEQEGFLLENYHEGYVAWITRS